MLQHSIEYGTLSASIADVLELLFDDFPEFGLVGIRSLDSQRDPLEIGKTLKSFGIASELVRDMAVVSYADSRHFTNRQLFAGFDELWFTSASVWACSVPNDLVLTSDAIAFKEHLPGGLADVMHQCACSLVMADGCGLNFATLDEAFATRLRNAFKAAETS